MFNFGTGTATAEQMVRVGAENILTDEEFIVAEIKRFLASKRRRDMIDGDRYYRGDHDILWAKRTMIGAGGELEEVKNLPNNRIVDNQYKRMVNQKTNYLLGQPVSVQTEDKKYAELLSGVFDKRFQRQIKNVGRDSFNCGLGWLFLYYDEQGQLSFRKLNPFELIPGWSNEEHTLLDYAIRIFEAIVFEGKEEKTVHKIEVYHLGGIHRFVYDTGRLIPDEVSYEPYFIIGEDGYNWERIPLIAFKRDSTEIPLINCVKSLQDGLNRILSTFENHMEEDARNTILVLVNYSGTDLGEFRRNLAEVGVVKVESHSEGKGDVKTLTVEVNAENYKAILEIFKRAIIENAMGFDAKDLRMTGNPNQMNIQSMYSDIDLDANEMETEFQAAFEDLLWFINIHLTNTGQGDFDSTPVDVIFNRDMLMSESEIITNVRNLVGLLPTKFLIGQIPWVDDPEAVYQELLKERGEAQDPYEGTLNEHGGTANEDA